MKIGALCLLNYVSKYLIHTQYFILVEMIMGAFFYEIEKSFCDNAPEQNVIGFCPALAF
jgi:hypothetical protein